MAREISYRLDRMVNVFRILQPIVKMIMKLAGVIPHKVEIEPGTVMNFWVPATPIKNRMQISKANHGKQPPVVLLHGFFANGIFTWLFQVLALASSYDVYVPDLLFFGDSITDKPDRSTSFQAECLAKGLSKLGVERCTVVGFSYGGVIAFKLAKMYPGLVESIVMTGAVFEFTQSRSKTVLDNAGFSTWSELLLPESVEEVKRLISIGSDAKLLVSFPSFVYRDFLQVMFPYRKERNELLRELVVPDEDQVTPAAYPQRVYFLWGENDRIIKLEDAKEALLELGDKGSLHLIKNSGHLAQVDCPSYYNKNLKQILACCQSSFN